MMFEADKYPRISCTKVRTVNDCHGLPQSEGKIDVMPEFRRHAH
jgi:hypothetical protein